MEAVIGIIGVVLNLFLLGIIFSIPGRFREQQEYMDEQRKEITNRLYALQKNQDELLRLVAELTEKNEATPNRSQPDHTDA